jgi:hypothetical protein
MAATSSEESCAYAVIVHDVSAERNNLALMPQLSLNRFVSAV